MSLQQVRIWDAPTRVFHWALALLVLAAFLTGLRGGNAMLWHGRIGLAILGLLSFRLAWGFVGSTFARFAEFLPTPARIRAYLRGQWSGLGHNPLGALSVFLLLALLLVQVLSGLFANDDIAFNGPLYALITKPLSNTLTGLHRQLAWLIGALVGVHLAAVVFHLLVRGENLIRPMITGLKAVSAEERATAASGGGPLALALALVLAAVVVWLASGVWIPAPAPLAPPVW